MHFINARFYDTGSSRLKQDETTDNEKGRNTRASSHTRYCECVILREEKWPKQATFPFKGRLESGLLKLVFIHKKQELRGKAVFAQ